MVVRDKDLKEEAFSTFPTKVIRPDEEEGDKELYAEMTSEEERTYRSAMAMDSEHSLSLSLSLSLLLSLRRSVPIDLPWPWIVSNHF